MQLETRIIAIQLSLASEFGKVSGAAKLSEAKLSSYSKGGLFNPKMRRRHERRCVSGNAAAPESIQVAAISPHSEWLLFKEDESLSPGSSWNQLWLEAESSRFRVEAKLCMAMKKRQGIRAAGDKKQLG